MLLHPEEMKNNKKEKCRFFENSSTFEVFTFWLSILDFFYQCCLKAGIFYFGFVLDHWERGDEP